MQIHPQTASVTQDDKIRLCEDSTTHFQSFSHIPTKKLNLEGPPGCQPYGLWDGQPPQQPLQVHKGVPEVHGCFQVLGLIESLYK